MAVPQQLLERLASSLRVTRVDPPLVEIGQFMRFGIGPDPGLLRGIDPDLATANLELILDAALQSQAVSSGATITGTVTDSLGAVLGTLEGSTSEITHQISTTIQDATGSPASLAGTLPIPVELPVKATVKWGAYRLVLGGGPNAADWTAVGPRPGGSVSSTIAAALADVASLPALPDLDETLPMVREELALGTDFLAPDGLDVIDAAFLFAPAFGELTVRLPQFQKVFVYATVTLSVPEQDSFGPFELPHVPVLLPVLPVPKLVAMFRFPDFNLETDGGVPKRNPAALLVVPADSPLGAYEALVPVLQSLRSVLAPFRSITRFARLLLGVNLLGSVLSRRPRLRLVSADRLDNLHGIRLIRKTTPEDPWVADVLPDVPGWYGDDEHNDIFAGDTMSSLIFLGPPGTKVECFQHPERSGDRLVITVGEEAVVMMSSLQCPAGADAPATVPAHRAASVPAGVGFDERISSLYFTD